jgi:dihydroorotase
MKLLIKGGRVIDPANEINDVLDVLIEDGRIKTVDRNIRRLMRKPLMPLANWSVRGLLTCMSICANRL